MEHDILLALAATLLSSLAIHFYCTRRPSHRLPPGPAPLPIIGNVHHIPFEYPQRTFAEWGKTYGNLIYINVLQQPIVVINSEKAAHDLLNKRSAKYSDRPRAVLLQELCGMDRFLVLLPYGEKFRTHRKWIQDAILDRSALKSYESLQRKETVTVLSGLIEKPDATMMHFKRFTAALMLGIAYGHDVTSLDDELVGMVERAMDAIIQTGAAAATLIDFFPPLRYLPAWFPGGGFKHRAAMIRSLIQDVYEKPFGIVQAQFAKGQARPSVIANLVEEATHKGTLAQDQDDIMGAGAMMYAGGTDTTNVVLSSFILAMILHQDVLRNAQEEIDRVVGSERLPDFPDIPSLPYLECILKETYRWNCPIPLGVAHRLMEDDEYRGYYIPRGSIVIQNLWNMTRDPEAYPQPERFRPERFQDKSSSSNLNPDPRDIVFGHGRRICPGKYLAEATILLVMANVISIFNIEAPKDQFGNAVMPQAKFRDAVFSHPEMFSVSFTPRSQRRVELVKQVASMY